MPVEKSNQRKLGESSAIRDEQMRFERVLASLQHVGGLLIKRGSAMGPLVPPLILSPVLLGAAWLFRSTFVIQDCPVISVLLVVVALGIVVHYLYHYSSFAKNDPDRLQSEEYRYETARMQMIAAKEMRYPIPAEDLVLQKPRQNLAELGPSSEEDGPPASTDTDGEKTT